jgi:hypothetical protein
MTQIAYTVGCRFTDANVMRDWIAWLQDEHLADVQRGGALSGQVVHFESELRCEVRYLFPNRDAFTRYEQQSAPTLRSEGLRKFPLELGLEYSRSVATIVATT